MGLVTTDAPLDSAALKPQDLVLTMLGSYGRGRHETVWSGGLVLLLREMGFSPAAARVALNRLVQRDLLSRVRTGRLIHYRMTAECERLLDEAESRMMNLGADQSDASNWTILWHDLPQDCVFERGRLARRLRFLGFGSPQDSLWISPLDRVEQVLTVVEELHVRQHIGLFCGTPAGAVDPRTISRGAWDLPALSRRYQAFWDEFEPALGRHGQPYTDDKGAFKINTRLIHLFQGFAALDPGLPDSMLEERGLRQRAIGLFQELSSELETAAQRHFDLAANHSQDLIST
jgi:phenylacetic acid degradation operon negative regulatory protein